MFQIHQPYYISINKSQCHKIPIANNVKWGLIDPPPINQPPLPKKKK